MKKIAFFFFTNTLLLFSQDIEKKKETIKQKHSQILSDIQDINDLLKNEKSEKKSILAQVESLNFKISTQEVLLAKISKRINVLNNRINYNQILIKRLKEELNNLKESYAEIIITSYKSRSKENKLLFILSSDDFLQAYKRLQYLRQYSNYRKKQGLKIKQKTEKIEKTTETLIREIKEQKKLNIQNTKTKAAILLEKEKLKEVITKIHKQEKKYLELLAIKKKESENINQQIENLIKQAIQLSALSKKKKNNAIRFTLTPESKKIGKDFSENKGTLIWPAQKGVKIRGYGQYRDPVYNRITYNNNGITIACPKGESARAIFKGEVSGIILLPNGNKAVQVRHGDYISTYYNLNNIIVKKGETVKRKQKLGDIYTNAFTNRTELKFFLYKNTKKLNPELWLYKG